ncbi:MAG TPA: nucleotide exchange factor GrpE, partial [Oculatellaceae cyanobacterium]
NSPSAEETETAEAAQEAWQAKYNLLQDQFTRLAADFDNYRKRVREEQETLARYGAQKAILEILPVLDNFERAAGTLSETSPSKTLFDSFKIMQKQLLDRLETLGVKRIASIGEPFDPQFHEAVNRMESFEFPENTVMYEAQSGYTLHDRVIRPAMVVVSVGAPKETESDDKQAETAEAVEETPQQCNPFRQ